MEIWSEVNIYISKFQLKNFRNYSDTTLEIGKGINYLIGENGKGKSNFLEAVYALSIGKSFRTSIIKNLIRNDSNVRYTMIRGIANQDTNVIDLSLAFSYEKLSKLSKKYLFNGSEVSSTDFIGRLNVVLFEAKDLNIVMGGPAERRKFLDIHISQQDHSYLKALQRFNKVLISRNRVLKDIKFNRSSKIELEFWTEKIIEDGLIIYKERELKLNQIRDQASIVFSKLIKSKEALDIEFKPSFSEFSSEVIDSDILYKIYHDISSKEVLAGTTLVGPHRDDFRIFINRKEASEFCSRGQIRTITLSMKLGEANVLNNNINQSPVLALDDVLSELDQARRDTIMEYISDYEQVLLTVPDSKLINNHHHNSYIVDHGNIIIK